MRIPCYKLREKTHIRTAERLPPSASCYSSSNNHGTSNWVHQRRFRSQKIVVLCNLWEMLSVPGDSKWRYRPLVGGQQQPLKRSLNPSLEKGHQQNCHEFSSSWFPNRWSSEGISFRNPSFLRGHIFYRNEFQRFVVQNRLDALLYGHQNLLFGLHSNH